MAEVGPTLRGLAQLEERRVHQPSDLTSWLRGALGDSCGSRAARRPLTSLLDGLSPVQRLAVGERLYTAVLTTMREVLGADHPDTLEATRGMAALAASRSNRSVALPPHR